MRDAPPIVVVAKSAKLRFRLRRKLRRSLAPPLPTARGAAGAPFGLAQKENAPRPVEEKKRFGGSVCASADLLPPAGDSWLSRAAVRDGNALPLGKPLARGGQGYIQRLFSLPLAGG